MSNQAILKLLKVPYPSLKEKFVIVENSFSLISIGTEKKLVDFGKSRSLIKKAISRPDLVEQVLKNFKKGFSVQLLKKYQQD